MGWVELCCVGAIGDGGGWYRLIDWYCGGEGGIIWWG